MPNTQTREVFDTLKKSFTAWNDDNALKLSAALSYYTIFSIGPLIILITGITGIIFGEEAIRGELSSQFQGLMGKAGAKALESFAASTERSSTGVIATITGIVTLIMGATGAFAELESSLNLIWKVERKKDKTPGIVQWFRSRLLTFSIVLVIGFLLLVSLLLNAVLAASSTYISRLFTVPSAFFQILNNITSMGLVTVLFAMIFKILPNAAVRWKDVWLGAFFTSILFTLGKFLIGLYIGNSSPANSFGASATVILVMVWTYYSSLILFFGAEFTKVVSSKNTDLNPTTPNRVESSTLVSN